MILIVTMAVTCVMYECGMKEPVDWEAEWDWMPADPWVPGLDNLSVCIYTQSHAI